MPGLQLTELKKELQTIGFLSNGIEEKQEVQSKLEHQFVPALEFCGWLDDTTKEEYDLKRKVQSCYPYCCFNHLVGLPRTEELDDNGNVIFGNPVEFTEYERRVIYYYELHKLYAGNKCRGAGLTTLFVRHYCYKYAITNTMPGRKALICAGNGLALSLDIMERIKMVLDKIPFVYLDGKIPNSNKPREIDLRSLGKIIAIASEVITLAGYENVGDVLGDEITKWNLKDDTPVIKTLLPYATKSLACIAFFGTPYGQRGFAYDKLFNPELIITAGFFVQVLNWREAVGIPEEDIEIIRGLVDTPQKIIREIYTDKYEHDEEYREWFHGFFGNDTTIQKITSIVTSLLHVQKIIDAYDTERETYDQEFDNQYIIPADSLYGDHTKLYSTEDFEPEDIGVPQE